MMADLDLIQDDARDLARAWWLLVFIGLVSLVAGVILVFRPSNSLTALAVVVGIFLLLDGIVELIRSFGHEVENRALAAILGVLAIIVGIALVRHPLHGVTAVGLLIGIWLVASGVIRLLRGIAFGSHPLLLVAIALVEIVVGIVIVSDPHIGYTALAILLGIWLIINGIGTIAFGVAIRGSRTEAGASSPAA
jgi:uncharacterized membrane protein HdeD (DUF308 family)